MSMGIHSAYPNISEIFFGSPVGEWLMAAVTWYAPTLGAGGWQFQASTGTR
jgi:hypothetical protein